MDFICTRIALLFGTSLMYTCSSAILMAKIDKLMCMRVRCRFILRFHLNVTDETALAAIVFRGFESKRKIREQFTI